jgi:hypothetical protein
MTRPHDPVTAEPCPLQQALGDRATALEKDCTRAGLELEALHLKRNRMAAGEMMAHAVGTFKYILGSGGPEGIPADQG